MRFHQYLFSTHFFISFLSLRLLPDNFGDLKKLQRLDLSHNDLVMFPQDHVDVLASLYELDVSHNHIDQMPIHFPYLYRLRILRAKSNDLTSLPGEMERLQSLEIFDLSDNILAALPETICKLPAIRELDVSDNKITVGFPKAWENLRQRATVACGEQSSHKERPPQDRPQKEEEVKDSPKAKKKGGKKSPSSARKSPSSARKSDVIKSAPPVAT